MVQVLLQWFEDTRPLTERKFCAWMPECPRVGDTVHIPLDSRDWRGNYSGTPGEENSIAKQVNRVAWTCDETAHWHAEVWLR